MESNHYKELKSAEYLLPAQSRKRIKRWLYFLSALAFLILFLPWQQNINGVGRVTSLLPNQRAQGITSLIGGRIEIWNIMEGQYVQKGDTIAMISEVKEKFFDPQLLQRLQKQLSSKEGSVQAKGDKINKLETQVQALKNGLQAKLRQARNKIEQSRLKVVADSNGYIAARLEYTIADTQYKRFENLFQKKLISLTQLESRNLKLQETRAKLVAAESKFFQSKNDLTNAYIDLTGIDADALDKISKAESTIDETSGDLMESEADVAKLKTELANMSLRNGLYIIRAPQTGYIIKTLKTGIGELLKDGEEIATILPEVTSPAVELYVNPQDVPLLYTGCEIRLRFDGWPAIVFGGWPGASVGTYAGKVKVIDYIAQSNGKVRVLVTPDPAHTPWPQNIRQGTMASGWGMLKEVPIWYELWRTFNGFPPDLLPESDAHQKRKEK